MKSLPAIILALVFSCSMPHLHADEASQRTAAAEDLINAMHLEKIMDQMRQNITKMTAGFSKDLSPEARKQSEQRQNEMFDTILKWDTLKQDYIQIYSEVYTEQELRDLAVFYKSPVGQKFIEKMPEVQQKSMEVMQKRIMPLLQKMREQARSAATPPPAAPAPATSPK